LCNQHTSSTTTRGHELNNLTLFRRRSQRTSLVCTMEDWALSLALSARKSFTTLAAGSCDGSIRCAVIYFLENCESVSFFTEARRLFDLTNHRNLSTLQGDSELLFSS
jgi:hypothetical protein